MCVKLKKMVMHDVTTKWTGRGFALVYTYLAFTQDKCHSVPNDHMSQGARCLLCLYAFCPNKNMLVYTSGILFLRWMSRELHGSHTIKNAHYSPQCASILCIPKFNFQMEVLIFGMILVQKGRILIIYIRMLTRRSFSERQLTPI